MHSRNILFEYNSSPSMIRDSDVCGLVTCLIFKFHLVNRASLIMLMCMQRRKRHLVRARIQSSLFAASRATGRIFVIDANSLEVKNEFQVGSRPDGLAHDPNRKNFLVADVADSNARLFHIQTGEITGTTRLRGRSRWTFFDKKTDRFLVNFRDPVEFALLHN